MPRSAVERLSDIAEAIGQIRSLLDGRSFESLAKDRAASAAFERFLEIISEASRHVPDELKKLRPEIPWRRVADIGNWLRHAYDGVDPHLLWQIYESDLDALDDAVSGLIGRLRRPE